MKEDTIIIAVPASSLSEATQARIAELTRERDEARRQRGDFRIDSSPADAQVACLRAERDAARRDASTALGAIVAIGEAIRSEPGEDILDAARRVVREREDMRQQRDAARIDADQYRKSLDGARARIATLESALRDFAKVLA